MTARSKYTEHLRDLYPDGYRLAEPASADDKRAEIVMRALEKGRIRHDPS